MERTRGDCLIATPARLRAVLAVLAAALLATACSKDGRGAGEEKAATDAAAAAFEKVFDRGPVSFALRLDRQEIDLSGRVVLEQELRVKPGFEAEFPEYLPEDFEGFSVVEIETDDDRRFTPGTGGGAGTGKPASPEVRVKRLVLEPDRSGTLAIAPLAVYFHQGGEKKEDHFLTEEIEVTVKPLEDIGSLDVRPPREIFEAPPQPADGVRFLWPLAGGAAVLLVAFLVWYLRRRPRRAPPPTPPHEIAWDALRRLVAQDFVGKGEIELFFVHLSAILRAYIENRFEVHAPERTTEEFLEEASRASELAGHRETLGEFLRLSDQVKFARFQPETATIQSSFDVVKQFIQETSPHES